MIAGFVVMGLALAAIVAILVALSIADGADQ